MSELDQLLDDDARRKKAFVAYMKALERSYSVSDWIEFGHQHNIEEISGNQQLLRAAQFGNDDYGKCIIQTLDFLYDNDCVALKKLMAEERLLRRIKHEWPEIYAAVHDQEPLHVKVVETHQSKLEVVRKALKDADNLLRTGGPSSAFDRVHTALHGYLKEVCDLKGLPYGSLPSITELYKTIRTSHPAFAVTGTHADAIKKVANGMASALDGINTLRNQASAAHPNEELLDDVDATLAFNATRTILNYVLGKVGD
jgi:hypothetical protein